MKHKTIDTDLSLEDIFSSLEDDISNVSFLAGTNGWKPFLAWSPIEAIILDWADKSAISSFVAQNQSENRLLVGFLSYELAYELNNIKSKKIEARSIPKVNIYAYENYLSQTNAGIALTYTDERFVSKVQSLLKKNKKLTKPGLVFTHDMTNQKYSELFNKIQNYIANGDVYQLNLTHQLSAKSNLSGRQIFSCLLKSSAKMSAYFEGENFELASNSPERLVQINIESRAIETFPIKGTSLRGKTKQEENKNIQKLLNDEKEQAELYMITDLLRNDLSKVCKIGTVKITAGREIAKLKGLIHTYSHIVGTLKPDINPIEALLSVFPGGSITGCPKRRAIEIIDELEPTPRQAYCGTIFSIDSEGNLDSNILIRTIVKTGDNVALSVGGGIVHDSVLEQEYKESLDKARTILDRLG